MPVIDFKNMDKLFILLYRQKMKTNEFENKIVIMENFNPSLELASPNVIAEVFMEFLKKNKINSDNIEIITVIPLKFATYVGFANKDDIMGRNNIMEACSKFNKKEILN